MAQFIFDCTTIEETKSLLPDSQNARRTMMRKKFEKSSRVVFLNVCKCHATVLHDGQFAALWKLFNIELKSYL